MSMQVVLRCSPVTLNEVEFANRLIAAVHRLMKAKGGYFYADTTRMVVEVHGRRWVADPVIQATGFVTIGGASIPPLKVVDAEPEP